MEDEFNDFLILQRRQAMIKFVLWILALFIIIACVTFGMFSFFEMAAQTIVGTL